jgi:hypothetical protein
MHWKDAPRLRHEDGIARVFGWDDAAMLAVGIGSSLLGKASSNSATKKATEASTAATDKNIALARDMYGQNQRTLAPYVQAGNAGTNALMQWLGVNGASPGAAVAPANDFMGVGATGAPGSAGGFNAGSYLQANPDIGSYYQQNLATPGFRDRFPTPEAFADYHYQTSGQQEIANGQRAPLPGSQPMEQVQAPQSQPAAPDQNAFLSVAGVGARPTFERPADMAAPTFTRPADTARPDMTRPGMTRPDMAPLDVSLNAFTPSPDFEFQQQRGMGALKGDKSLSGLLHSGSAVKSALDFSQNLALGDYDQWRSYVTGQYNTNRARMDANFNTDASRSDNNFAFDANRSDSNFANDRARTDNNFGQDREFGYNDYRYQQGRKDGQFTDDRRSGPASTTRTAATPRADTTPAPTTCSGCRGRARAPPLPSRASGRTTCPASRGPTTARPGSPPTPRSPAPGRPTRCWATSPTPSAGPATAAARTQPAAPAPRRPARCRPMTTRSASQRLVARY